MCRSFSSEMPMIAFGLKRLPATTTQEILMCKKVVIRARLQACSHIWRTADLPKIFVSRQNSPCETTMFVLDSTTCRWRKFIFFCQFSCRSRKGVLLQSHEIQHEVWFDAKDDFLRVQERHEEASGARDIGDYTPRMVHDRERDCESIWKII